MLISNILTNTTSNQNNYSLSVFMSLVILTSISHVQPVKAQEQINSATEELTISTENQINPSVTLKVKDTSVTEELESLPEQIIVENFQVKGSSIFSEAELKEVLAEYLNRPLSLSELYQARSAITELYTDKGYVNSGAYIPPQKLVSRRNTKDSIDTVQTLEIAILEGKLEGIKVTGVKHLNPDYIRSRIQANAGTPINVDELLVALQALRVDPLIENISAELSAGISPGTSLLEVAIKEADPFYFTTQFDNKRSPSVGTNRRGIGLVHANLLGFGDQITFDYANSEGSDSFDTSYSLPFNGKNGTFRMAYGQSDNDIIEEPFTPLDIESKSRYYELGIRQPLIGTAEEEFALGLTFSFQESETRLLDTPFPLSNGADENGETRIGALRFVQDYTNRNDHEVWALRSQFSFGLDVFGATQNVDGVPDSTFFAWRGQSQWVRRLDEDFLFFIRGDVQLSSTELVPLEQFRLGGGENVRGYRQDATLGDNGLFLSAEMRIPLFHLRKIDGVMQLTPFVDMGTVWNSNETEINNDFLTSIGLGLNFSAGNGFNARIDWGIPLVDVKTQGDSLQENGVTFSLNWNFL